MGNVFLNTIKADGLENLDIFSKDGEGNWRLDFEKVMPSPQSIEDCPEIFRLKGESDADKRHIAIKQDKPWFDWFNWRSYFWGAGHNSYGVDGQNKPQAGKSFIFYTSHGSPFPIFAKISRMLPGIEVAITFLDTENIGAPRIKMIWKDGKNSRMTYQPYDWDKDQWGEECEDQPMPDNYLQERREKIEQYLEKY